ncbi:MAG: hypothetical protein JOZ10_11215 [Acidobacteria bacterium]|nr:hypothetical protein [Acidobacteriota bacterium]MBV9145833.1 hypothetical protein [Acidobacteriota bacterium]
MSPDSNFVNRHPWLAALIALVLVQLASSGALKGPTLSAFADVVQFAIMLLMVVGTAINIRPSRGSARGFWTLMTLSAAMWATDYGYWVYYEVIRRVQMPAPQPGDTLLILHVVPIMMAAALLPHRMRSDVSPESRYLGFGLIASWWVYLYFQFVYVWQSLHFDALNFHRNFNLLYHAELATVILAFLFLSQRANSGWHEVFHHYLMGFLIYAPTSAVINILIQQNLYSSGGLWDLPLTVSIAYIAWIGFHAHKLQLEQAQEKEENQFALGVPEWAVTLAGASIPAIALVSFTRLDDPARVRYFRTGLGFAAMLVIALLIFTRQQLLNRRLRLLLLDSKQAYNNLERLQTQVAQSEKLASIGRLVSGAAHELNNPLTAILGYSELIADNQEVPPAPRGFAQKIAHQARRTKALVESLLSFAGQRSSSKRLTDLNSLLSNASQLRMGDVPAGITLVRDLQPELPLVMADDNQLLQVIVHILNNAIDSLEGVAGGQIVVRTRAQDDRVIMEIADNGPGVAEPARVFDPFYTTKPLGQGTGLGLSACYGIIQEHQGTIECLNLPPRGAMFRVSLKAVVRSVAPESAVVS